MLDHAFEDHDEMRERETVDDQSERDRAALTGMVRYCPACGVEVLTNRRGICLWCDGATQPLARGAGETPEPATTSPVPATRTPQPRPGGTGRAGAAADHHEERSAA